MGQSNGGNSSCETIIAPKRVYLKGDYRRQVTEIIQFLCFSAVDQQFSKMCRWADHMDAPTLNRFLQAFLRADKSTLGRQLLTLWSMTEFQKVPKDYMKMVKEIAKTYPAPDEAAKVTTTHSN